jgi:lipopolysaccharide export system protein LptA
MSMPSSRPHHNKYFPIVLFALSLGLIDCADARKADRQQAMDINANNGDWSTAESGISELSGAVHIEQGSLKIDADKARIQHGKKEIESVVLFGTPARLQEELDDGSGMVNASAREIQYDLNKNEVLLIGAVEVKKPRGKLTGERIRYDLGSGRMNAEGGSSRIQMRLEPAKVK